MNRYCIAILLAVCAVSPAAGQSPFRFQEISPTALQLSENGKPVFVYNFGMVLASGFPEEMRRSSYLHPVYAPDGTLLTDDFDPDHPHHRGISWMWPEVSVGGKKGDVWMVKEFHQRFVRWKARDTDGPQARLAIENGWFDGERKFVNEDVEIVAGTPPPTTSGCWSSRSASRPRTGRWRSWARRKGRRGSAGSASGSPRATAAPRRRSFAPIRESRRRMASYRAARRPRSPGPSRARPPAPHRRYAVESRLSEQRLAHAARVRLPERFVSGAPTDHAPSGQAPGAEVSRDTVRGHCALRTLLWSWLR